MCTWYGRSKLQRTGPVEPRNVACQNSGCGNSNGVARSLQGFIYGEEVIGWKIIYNLIYHSVDAFEL